MPRKTKHGRKSTRTRQRLLSILILVLLLIPASATAQGGTTSSHAYIAPTVLADVRDGGKTTAWVVLRPKANLKRADKIEDWNERGQFVYDQLTKTAENTQRGLRKHLEKRGVAYEPFWIVNSIQVTADEAVLNELARRPEVEQIAPVQVYQLPEPTPGTSEETIQNVEWGIDRINAPDVWSTYGVHGEGIVVASIDTGVRFDHPALAAQYRGNQGGGSFDHNYNWFNPTSRCSDPQVPCDNHNHGTHVTGTMVGDDGGTNQIGVAPGAQWIATKGCENTTCSDGALMAAGQWLLAPTDLNGENPRPDLRPHIINNSWGGGAPDPWYQGIVNAWIASGVFPMFAIGNSGSACGTAETPGNYVTSYSAGAFDSNNRIAAFSSRGASAFGGEIKPNIAAPGVSVRSSVRSGGYASFSGTSMASPHVAGAVALIWSAKPALIGDIDATRELLDQTAIDTENLQCGGTAEDNNVFGEGRLDVLGAIDEALANEPPIVDAGGPYGGGEGSPIALAGSASDPNGDALTSNWTLSDGAPCAFDDPSAPATTITCADDGDYTVTLTVSDGENDPVSDSTTVDVSNVVPLVDAGNDATVDDGALFSRIGSFTDPGADSWTATVDYGDGGGVEGLVLNGTSFTLSHIYSGGANDPFTVTVCVTDDDGGEGCDSFDVEVLSAREQIAQLATTIEGMELPGNTSRSLLNRLAEIDASIEAGATTDACNQLGAFINHVEAQAGKKLPQADADQIIADVDRIRATLGCG